MVIGEYLNDDLQRISEDSLAMSYRLLDLLNNWRAPHIMERLISIHADVTPIDKCLCERFEMLRVIDAQLIGDIEGVH